MQSQLTATSTSQVQVILMSQPPEYLGLQACATTPTNFVFFVETGFLHVGQAALELPTSGDLPASASQSAGITSVSHCTQLLICIFVALPAYSGKHARTWTYVKSDLFSDLKSLLFPPS